MPTGYTAALEENGYNVKKWLKENAIRAMGVCVSLRDGGKMDENQIREQLGKQSGESYHTGKLRAAKRELNALEKMTDDEWQGIWKSAKAVAKTDNAKRTAEFNSKKANHIKAMNEIDALLSKAQRTNAGEVATGTLRFAKEQLADAFNFDYSTGPYLNENEGISLELFKKKSIDKALWDVNYHTEQGAKEKSRNTYFAEEYDRFTKFVDSAK